MPPPGREGRGALGSSRSPHCPPRRPRAAGTAGRGRPARGESRVWRCVPERPRHHPRCAAPAPAPEGAHPRPPVAQSPPQPGREGGCDHQNCKRACVSTLSALLSQERRLRALRAGSACRGPGRGPRRLQRGALGAPPGAALAGVLAAGSADPERSERPAPGLGAQDATTGRGGRPGGAPTSRTRRPSPALRLRAPDPRFCGVALAGTRPGASPRPGAPLTRRLSERAAPFRSGRGGGGTAECDHPLPPAALQVCLLCPHP